MRRLHDVPYSHRLTGVVAAGAVVSGVAAVLCSVEVAAAASTLTNLIWILGACDGQVHKIVVALSSPFVEGD